MHRDMTATAAPANPLSHHIVTISFSAEWLGSSLLAITTQHCGVFSLYCRTYLLLIAELEQTRFWLRVSWSFSNLGGTENHQAESSSLVWTLVLLPWVKQVAEGQCSCLSLPPDSSSCPTRSMGLLLFPTFCQQRFKCKVSFVREMISKSEEMQEFNPQKKRNADKSRTVLWEINIKVIYDTYCLRAYDSL